MRRFVCFLLILGLAVSFVFARAGSDRSTSGRLICGITEYEPMNFRDARGNWTGFDTEFAGLVGEKLGLQVVFQLIEWGNKFIELDSRAIDAIWNGFTATANEPDGTPRANLCDMSYSYMLNTQCVVVRAERAREFSSSGALAGKTLAVEAGSAGETKAKDLVGQSGRIIGAPAQINTFMEVKAGASDGAVIDLILARQITGSGDYTDLVIADIDLGSEVFAIGFRKGDPLRDRVNQAILELNQEGKLRELARKYGLIERFVIDTNFGRR